MVPTAATLWGDECIEWRSYWITGEQALPALLVPVYSAMSTTPPGEKIDRHLDKRTKLVIRPRLLAPLKIEQVSVSWYSNQSASIAIIICCEKLVGMLSLFLLGELTLRFLGACVSRIMSSRKAIGHCIGKPEMDAEPWS
ncbi:hypothetical protein Pelo_8587 [Pelomyxa schiedti]|nr:hypothetical protein Pelo_8587 [Pelomyxa schiedti]